MTSVTTRKPAIIPVPTSRQPVPPPDDDRSSDLDDHNVNMTILCSSCLGQLDFNAGDGHWYCESCGEVHPDIPPPADYRQFEERAPDLEGHYLSFMRSEDLQLGGELTSAEKNRVLSFSFSSPSLPAHFRDSII